MTILSREMNILLNKKPAIDIEFDVKAKRKYVESIERYTENRVIRKTEPKQKAEY